MSRVEKDSLTLKWGTLKAWHFHRENGQRLIKEYFEIGSSMSAALKKDTPRQKEIVLELIDECDGDIWNDWDNVKMTKDEAKAYVLNYGKKVAS